MTDTVETATNDLNHALNSIDAIIVGLQDRYGPRNRDEAGEALKRFSAEMSEGGANKLVWQQRTISYGQLVASRILIDQNAHIIHMLTVIASALGKGFTSIDEGQRAGMALVADALSAAIGEPEPEPTPAPPPAARPRLEVVPKDERPKGQGGRGGAGRAGRKLAEDADTADKPKGGTDAAT